MAAGRPAKPTALKKLSGTLRSDRENKREPKPAQGAAPPDYLKDEEKIDFLAFAKEFNAVQILTVLDAPILAILCELYRDYRELKNIIVEQGYMVEHVATGGILVKKLNPVAPQLNKVRDQILAILREFGATPASRAKVNARDFEGDSSDPVDDYLKNKGL